jgi:hypothetical protein
MMKRKRPLKPLLQTFYERNLKAYIYTKPVEFMHSYNFLPSLTFTDKAMGLPLECSGV